MPPTAGVPQWESIVVGIKVTRKSLGVPLGCMKDMLEPKQQMRPIIVKKNGISNLAEQREQQQTTGGNRNKTDGRRQTNTVGFPVDGVC